MISRVSLYAVLCLPCFVLAQQPAQPTTTVTAPAPQTAELAVMERVADWQIAHPAKYPATDWTQAAYYCGMMALAEQSKSPRFEQAMIAMGEATHWELGPVTYFPDDHCVGQTYAELYLRRHDARMIAPMRERFDYILANPKDNNLDFTQPWDDKIARWSWCDSLFMAPPAWLRLWVATGDKRYLDYMVEKWWVTSDYLYDTENHLYFRDSTYFKRREANGKKVFWGRGNGWVMAGLARVIPLLPADHPARPRFIQQFREMADAVLVCQQSDGLWRASLLDPKSYPNKETSGSGFYCFAFAWGINQGLLDKAKFGPATDRAWAALVECVDPDGKLTHVQPQGASPTAFDPNSTDVFGVGAFLLAGSEINRLRSAK